jgi:hypothetical protein
MLALRNVLSCSRADPRAWTLLSALLVSSGCNGVFWGNLGVLCVTVAIFLGTVFLSRSSEATRSAKRSVPPPSTTTHS